MLELIRLEISKHFSDEGLFLGHFGMAKFEFELQTKIGYYLFVFFYRGEVTFIARS
jgi:hypothetical protein